MDYRKWHCQTVRASHFDPLHSRHTTRNQCDEVWVLIKRRSVAFHTFALYRNLREASNCQNFGFRGFGQVLAINGCLFTDSAFISSQHFEPWWKTQTLNTILLITYKSTPIITELKAFAATIMLNLNSLKGFMRKENCPFLCRWSSWFALHTAKEPNASRA